MAITFLTDADKTKLLNKIAEVEGKIPEDVTITDEQLAAAVEAYFAEHPIDIPSGGGGLTTAQISAMDDLFRIAAYTEDASAKYAAFRQAFGLDEPSEPDVPVEPDEPDKPEIVYYTVTNNLTNVTNSNAETSVAENAAYSARLSVADGHDLDTLTITMGGVDITATAYQDGSIMIAPVTGDVVITATAISLQYIDLLAGGNVSITNFYSDGGSAKLATKYEHNLVCSLVRTESDITVTVVLSNNGETDVSGTAYVGAAETIGAAVKVSPTNVYFAKVGTTATVRAGQSVQFEYTLPAGYYLCVDAYKGVDVSAVGVLDVHEPVAEYATANKSDDTTTIYTGDGTDSGVSRYYLKKTYTTDTFAEDTELRITVPYGIVPSSNQYIGCCAGADTSKVYYAVETNFSIKENCVAVYNYTVKAGYALVLCGIQSGTVYVEKA